MGFSDLKNALKKIDSSLKGDKKASGQSSGYNRLPMPLPVGKTTVVISPEGDLFSKPISTAEPPSIFRRVNHSEPPRGCQLNEPIHTNNFYNNLALADQTFPVWTLPNSLWLAKDPGQDAGFAFNHTEAAQRVFGPEPDADPAQFYFNPPRIKSFVISGQNFSESNVQLTLLNHNKLSVVLKLAIDGSGDITVPLVHGMGFITAVYRNVVPVIASAVGIQSFERVGSAEGSTKYKAVLFNQVVWSIYVGGDVNLDLKDPNHLVGDKPANATVQFARGESKAYDAASGAYPIAAHLQGSVNGKKGTYKFIYEMNSPKTGLVWCLPHHQEALISEIKGTDAHLELDSTTKGVMKAYVTNELVMEEELPVNIGFEPWSSLPFKENYSPEVLQLIRDSAAREIDQDVVGMCNIDSMYTSGKVLDKFAYIAYVTHFILKDEALTSKILPRIKQSIEIFANNKQQYPLVYDNSWKGLISSADPGADFGNSNYNDHHFHYGYHIHAIALVGQIDNGWVKTDVVQQYVTTLLRDVANPSTEDKFFPQFRSFDWYHGHSFAHGIFASGDGKDEESSSEDYHFAYGMKLYAKVVGDSQMEARANLMLAVMKRSMNMYMLYSDDNKIQPKRFIKNKVAGISFENKIDFATYFGRGTIADEWIHGIHMLPITPVSSYIRGPTFVKEEWDAKLARIIDQIPDGWKGILMLNVALFDPKKAWLWFARSDWDDRLIDNGMSRTWSLAYIAGIGGGN